MAFVVEDGTGISGANAYVSDTFVDSYLADRSREGQNSWNLSAVSLKKSAIIAATDYIEIRWGLKFLGNRQFNDISAARATLTFTGQPADAETVTVGLVVYTFNTVLGGANSVLIGTTTEASILNLRNAILATATALGTEVGLGTVVHSDVTADEGTGDTLIAKAKEKGSAGNSVVTTETVATASWSSATLLGGGDIREPQSLSFPRLNLFDREGFVILGIPTKLEFATAEYAVRALLVTLMPDPKIDTTGRSVVRERKHVGPLQKEIEYSIGSQIPRIIHPYPAADKLLAEYVTSGSGVIRG